MIKNFIHIGFPLLLGLILYINNFTQNLIDGIALISFLTFILSTYIQIEVGKNKSEYEYFLDILSEKDDKKKPWFFKYNYGICQLILVGYILIYFYNK